MDAYKVGIEEDSEDCAETEMLSISDRSSQDETSRNRGRELNNQMKLRSIRLRRFPSLRSCMRPMKSPSSQSPSLISDCGASSEQSSPSYSKATSSSDARNGSSQKSSRILSRQSSFKPTKSLGRMSSLRFRRPFMRKSSGGADLKKKLKKRRSIKLAAVENAHYDQPSSTGLSSEAETSSEYLETHFQERLLNSESSFSNNDQNRRTAKIAKPKSDSSVRVLKTSSLRPQRMLTKTASLKSKRASEKCSDVSEISDSVGRATCSSTLKDSKFSHCVEHQTGGSESGGISAVKVCTYTYCSLHGHQHGTSPPLKRFVSMRRRLLKTQKSKKLDSHSVPKAKRSSKRRKGTQTSQVVCNGGCVDQHATQDSRGNYSVTHNASKVELEGAGIQFVEDKDIAISENLTQILLSETISHQSGLEQNRTSNCLTDKQCIDVASSAFQETSKECCSIAIEPFKQIPEASNTHSKEGEIVESGTDSGDDKLIHAVDHCEITDSSLPELKDSIQSDNLPLKVDDIVSTSNEGAPVDAVVNQEVNRDTAASLNLEIFKYNSQSEKVLDVSTTTIVTGEEKDEESEPDNGFHEGFSQSGYSSTNCTTDRGHKTQIKRQKFTGLWGLIYQNMVSGIAAEVETQLPLNGKDKEERVEEDHKLPHHKDPVNCQSSSGDKDTHKRDCDVGNQKFEFWQSDAIKLVQEAFDKILSEIPDQSSDDQSICSEITPERELLERKQSEDGEDISRSFDATNESVGKDPEETQLRAVNINASEKGKEASQLKDKSSQQISKNWSNLKKVIILKRFVKALEKVRNVNPGKPQFLPVEPDPETEKVHLRHQTTEERKNAEEWMLDHALRQVISKLAPAQKRKVALLVQAFETVTPLPEIGTHRRSSATASPHPTSIQATGEQNKGLLAEASYPEINTSFKETQKQVHDFFNAGQLISGTLASEAAQTNLGKEETVTCNIDKRDNDMPKEYQPDSMDSSSRKLEEPTLSEQITSKIDDAVVTSHEELANGKILSELCYSKVHHHNTEFNHDKLESINAAGEQACQPRSPTPEENVESTAVSSTLTSASFSEVLDAPATASVGEADQKYEVHQESSRPEEPEPNDAIDMSQEAKMDKQKYSRLWYLIYKHMVSTSIEGGTQSLLEGGADYKEQEGEAKTFFELKDADSCRDSSEMNQEIAIENQDRSSQEIKYHQIEAIKLIEEAIDEIQLPESQDDSPHDQSITGNMNPEMEIQKNHIEDGEPVILTATGSADEALRESNNTKLDLTTMDQREARLNCNDINSPEESETVSTSGNKSKPKLQKNWSNLKKLILLKRFIKALEKVRKFNPREPRYLPLDPDSEAEKVHLRHQSTEDRKNAEEWMLDYALQQVVAKLTPARKRKVELLVEAFETVTPTLEDRSRQRQSAAASAHAKLILA